jgi:hypothetical protein
MSTTATETQSNDGTSLAGFAGLSDSDFMEIGTQAEIKTETPAATTQTTPAAEKPENLSEKKEEAPKAEGKVEATAPKLGEEGETKKTEEEGFKLPGEVTTKQEVEAKWADIAKEVGFEINEDTFEAFVSGQKEFIENTKKTAKEEVKEVSFKEQIAELPAESQLLMIGLRQGLTREEIEKPFKMISEFKALSDADLVAKDFELKGYPEDLIAHKIEQLTTDDKLELAAKELRLILDQNEKGLMEQKLKEVKELEESSEKIFKEKLAKETDEVAKFVNMHDKFLDSPVSQKNKQYLIDQWKSGKYQALAKDPKVIVEFMLWKEFGEQGVANLKNNLKSKMVEEKAREMHNNPPVIATGSATSQSEGARNPLGNFAAFDHLQET